MRQVQVLSRARHPDISIHWKDAACCACTCGLKHSLCNVLLYHSCAAAARAACQKRQACCCGQACSPRGEGCFALRGWVNGRSEQSGRCPHWPPGACNNFGCWQGSIVARCICYACIRQHHELSTRDCCNSVRTTVVSASCSAEAQCTSGMQINASDLLARLWLFPQGKVGT